jgi:hypothetical protein
MSAISDIKHRDFLIRYQRIFLVELKVSNSFIVLDMISTFESIPIRINSISEHSDVIIFFEVLNRYAKSKVHHKVVLYQSVRLLERNQFFASNNKRDNAIF